MEAMPRAFMVGARGLLRAPAFTWSAVLLLGLGVGAVTTMFTLVDHLFLRPLPHPHAERLVWVHNPSHSFPTLRDLEAVSSVEAWVAASADGVDLTGEGDPEQVVQARITEGFLAMFGARAALGRLFLPEDFMGADVVVLSHGAWERLWGGDPGVVGRVIRLDGGPVVVAGVLEPSFVAPEAMVDRRPVDLWRPIDLSDARIEERGWTWLKIAGRLTPGATLADASREAAEVSERRAREFPDSYVRRDGSIVDLPILTLQEATVGGAREGLSLLMGAVTLLLVVACANLAHLFMARGMGRSRELAVRRALGAGRVALAGQIVVESLLVAAGGTIVGGFMAACGLRAFLALAPEAVPRMDAVSLDGRVLVFAAALSALTAMVFGLLPTLRIWRRVGSDALRGDGPTSTVGRSTRAVRDGLVALEVALSLVLLSSAGLLIQSFARLHEEPLGFRTRDVWTLPLRVSGATGIERAGRIAEALRAVPSVRSVTYTAPVPLVYTGGRRCCWGNGVRRPDAEGDVRVTIHPYAGDYVGVFESRVLAGRPWSTGEAEATPAPALLNEPLASALFGSAAAAIGREVAFVQGTVHRVLGVLAEDRHYGPDQDHGPAMYVPIESVGSIPGGAAFAIRVEGAGPELPRLLREAVWNVEPDLPVPLVRSMEEWAAIATAGTRFDSWLFTAFGVVALLLAAGGLYGTLLYAVGIERRELGIRLALGAGRRAVEARVVGRGLRTAAAGAALGLGAAWVSGRFLESRLFGVEAGDPVTLAGATAVLMLVAALASWIPAHRAASTDPLETLRQE